MHGAGEQQQQQYLYARSDEQPSTSSQHNGAPQMHQGNVMRTPTMSAASTSSSAVTGSVTNIVRMGEPIKIGNNILQPAGTLVFSQGSANNWASGQRVLVSANKHAVVQANLFPIGAHVLSIQQQPNSNYYVSQPTSSTLTGVVSNPNSATTSSATPDSGIQSVPTSPPSPSYAMSHEHEEDGEDDDDPADFTDMPKLKPMDEEDYDAPSTSAAVSFSEETNAPSTSTSVPPTSSGPMPIQDEFRGLNAEDFISLAFANDLNPEELVRRLFEINSGKAASIASLIRKRVAEESKNERRKKEMEAEVSSTTPTTPRSRVSRKRTRCTRNTSSPDVTTSTSFLEEPSTSTSAEDLETRTERKKRGRKPKKRSFENEEDATEQTNKKLKVDTSVMTATSEPTTSRPQSAMTSSTDPVQFRMRVRELMDRQLTQLTQRMSTEMTDLRLSHSVLNKSVSSGKRKGFLFHELNEQSKKIRKGQFGKRLTMFMTKDEIEADEEVKVKDIKDEIKQEEEDVPKSRGRLLSRRTRVDESPEAAFDVEGKWNGEFFEISKSVPSSESVIQLWKAPHLTCGCTKGACTSDIDCLNRAMRVQCNSDCTLPHCANRRFWKEDNSKLYLSNVTKTARVLKAKVARRAGDFLCEYAGEVITSEEAQKRFKGTVDNRIVAISSQLFVDSTNRANLARYVKHSCKPNSRLEVWSVNGVYRTGIFALIDLGANVEITVDKSGLIPSSRPCNCEASGCLKVIRGVRRAVTQTDNEDNTGTLFLARNYKKTLRIAQRSGLPAILTTEEPTSSDSVLQMKKVLAAFAFRVRNVDGTLDRSMVPYYSSICRFLKNAGPDTDVAELIVLIRKWLEAIDDDDLERAFVAIVSFYLSPSLLTSAKKPKENAPRARAPSTSCHSPYLSRRPDADLSYLESQHPIGSYDPDDAWESYRVNNSVDNAVRCVCGALDEDGDMVQCDDCHFWLHVECCTFETDKESEKYSCDFCVTRENRPATDIVLKSELDVRFANCDYHRALMNRRGIQVRLNETVYVNRIPPEDHKALLRNLREEKKGSKPTKVDKALWPPAPSGSLPPQKISRKDVRIFRVERLFVCPGNNRFVFGFFYAFPHETFTDTSRVFCKKEVFGTPYYETLPLDEVVGRCLVVDPSTWSKGRPKVPKYKEDDVYLCEMQIGKNKRVFEKVPPKNRYPINMQPYVFTRFSQPKKIVRNFRPYPATQSPKPPKTPTIPHQTPTVPSPAKEDPKKSSQKKNIDAILGRLRARRSKSKH